MGNTVKIRSREGGEFDCYLVTPKADGAVPAIVLASAVHGVDADIRALADEFAAGGVIAAAPDLFWRTIPGPVSHDDGRAQQRSQPRLERIKTGESEMADTLAHLRTMAQFNGRRSISGRGISPWRAPTRSSIACAARARRRRCARRPEPFGPGRACRPGGKL